MGYYSDFNIKVYNVPTADELDRFLITLNTYDYEEFNDQKVSKNKDGTFNLTFIRYNAKWYDIQEDLVKISTGYPYLIEMDRQGEEPDDTERSRFKNGKSETVTAIKTFPEFKELTLD